MMRKCFLLEAVNAPIAQSGSTIGCGGRAIDIDLPAAFHEGYIDLHGQVPVKGNPLFDEYLQFVVEDDAFFRFYAPGPATDQDAMQLESHRLGRIFGRAFLSQKMGYTWFAHFKKLRSVSQDGWSIRPAHPGRTPDWLIASHSEVAAAEAKGTRRSVTVRSRPKSWVKQVRNIVLERFGHSYRLKTWIVATCWVTTAQPQSFSKIYAEDPPLDGNGHFTPDELSSVIRWIATVHTANNLQRLGMRRLALRLLTGNQKLPRTRVILWRSLIPALSNRFFLGLPRFHFPDESLLLWMLICCRAHCSGNWNRWREGMCSLLPELLWFGIGPFFDGLDLNVVKSLLRGVVPKSSLDGWDEVNQKIPEGVSFLRDGSVIMPLEFIEPVETMEL